MNEQCQMEVYSPMFHLAERNLLMKIFQERIKRETIDEKAPYRISLTICSHEKGQDGYSVVLKMTMQRGKDEDLPKKGYTRGRRIHLHEGRVTPLVQAWQTEAWSESRKIASVLIADMAEVLKLFANGDCFMKLSAEKLIAKIAAETGIEDPTAWTRAYLEKPPYMERPEVRRYYRLYNKHLDHAKPQNLLHRKVEELVETPV